MLDRRILRENPEAIQKSLDDRGNPLDLGALIALDEERRSVIEQAQSLREQRNVLSKKVGQLMRSGGGEEAEAIKQQVSEIKDALDGLETRERELDAEFDAQWAAVPNIPRPEVPVGKTDEDNVVVHERGEIRAMDFEPLPHWEVAERVGAVEWDRAAKIAAARFVVDIGLGATLERSIINLMLDTHTRKHGYTEIMPPFLANTRSVFDCGMLPKFEDDMFKTREGLYLIPTGEVPLTNMHQDETVDGDALPLCYTTYTPSFRSEAGSAGQESRGLVRVHQFHKVEMMKFVKPEQADEELEKLTRNAETILDMLGLAYRRVALCTGDITFSSCQTFDLEVWMPGMGKWMEISSCSQYGDFQARRANTKYKADAKAKPMFVNTMNGSGLACGRTLAAILENYQNADGSVTIPEALRGYMGGEAVIYPKDKA